MYNYVLSCELLKIMSVLAVPLKHDTVFKSFLKYYWTIIHFLRVRLYVNKLKFILKLFEFIFCDFL